MNWPWSLRIVPWRRSFNLINPITSFPFERRRWSIPKRRSIYIEPDRYRLRSQSLPKLPPEMDKSSRSSSPKSFSDHGLGSDYASRTSLFLLSRKIFTCSFKITLINENDCTPRHPAESVCASNPIRVKPREN